MHEYSGKLHTGIIKVSEWQVQDSLRGGRPYKTANILTRSSISAKEAIRLHEKKLNKLGLAIGQVKLMGGN